MPDSFAHLHTHTSYSVLDGAAKIPEVVTAAKADGQTAIAATEHGNLYSAIELYKECKKQGGIKAIFGSEQYMVHDRLERSSLKKDQETNADDFKARYHLTVLAENNTGWQNLIKLSSDSFLKGFYTKPRVDWDSLGEFSDGLIVTTGCLGGVVLQHLLHDDYAGALKATARLQDIFGKDNLFVELQDHGIPEQSKTNPQLIDISKALGAPLVATNDIHYTHAHDSVAHDSLLCCQTGSLISDKDRFRFSSDQHYLKTAAEMRYIFREVEDACDNTLLIAERCNVDIDFDTLHLPIFPTPDGYTPISYLTELCYDSLHARGKANAEYIDRMAYELGVIDSLNLASYFLIVWDLCKYAAQQGIMVGPGRGSAAGSIVSWCLDITKPDPLKYGLIFERFIDPHRVALADIDLDFDTRYRDQMINYVKAKYGEDHVAQIITFSMIKARVAVKDAARVLGHGPEVGDKLSKAMPELLMGEDTPLWACFEKTERYAFGYSKAELLREMYNSNPIAKQVVDVALGLEGQVRQTGIHAAAVVIGDRPLTEFVPVQKDATGPVVTQWPMTTIEALGLLKMDFLGLRNLDVISDTLELLDNKLDLATLPLDDGPTFNLLKSGKTTGVFQMESQGMKKLLQRLRPTNIEDLSAVIALYRPGPMAENMHFDYADRKNGRSPVTLFHEDARSILSRTQGLCIYQEQVMMIARKFAGYTFSEADALRKIMGKKLVDKMIAERDKFVNGCISQGYDPDFSAKLFDMVEGFARYSFNLAHSLSYAFIGYWTAYLKANHPKEYMAALCGSVMDDIERTSVFMNETREMGIDILTPDINKSRAFFSASDGGIIVGLAAIKGVGIGVAENILQEREKNGPYTSIINLVERCEPSVTVLNALAWAGALDEFGTRLGIVATSDNILAKFRKGKKKGLYQAEELNLFNTDSFWDLEIPDKEYKSTELLAHEKKVLGLYISGHPLDIHKDRATNVTLSDLENFDQKFADILVVVTNVEIKKTRSGERMAILHLEDQSGAIECPIFPKQYSKIEGMFNVGDIGVVTLKVGSDRQGQRNYVYHLFDKIRIEADETPDGRFLNIYFPRGFAQNEGMVSKLKGLLLTHSGPDPVSLFVGKQTRVKLPHDFSIRKSQELLDDIHKLFLEYKDL